MNSRRTLVDRGDEGIELHSFDLDMASAIEQPHTTIQFNRHQCEVCHDTMIPVLLMHHTPRDRSPYCVPK